MKPGIELTVIANDRTALLPQALFALTVTVPELLPIIAVMLVDVEVPDQPDGNVQV